jgi:hypothetical protein
MGDPRGSERKVRPLDPAGTEGKRPPDLSAVVFVIAVAGVLAVATLFSGGSHEPEPDPESLSVSDPTPAPHRPARPEPASSTYTVFGRELGVVLLFSDGIDGVTAVDPDNRLAARSVVDGARAGVPEYQLTRLDDHVVVGWGEIWASDMNTRKSTLLGEADFFVPAVEGDRVWLVDLPGEQADSGPAVAWQVSADGNAVTEPAPVAVEGEIAIGIPGGLAIETESGIALWNAATGGITNYLGNGNGRVADVSREGDTRLAWCEDPCSEMHVTALRSGDDLVITHPKDDDRSFDTSAARFASDGRFVAVPAGDDVVIIDLETRSAHVGFTLPEADVGSIYVGWDRFGPSLYASTYSYGRTSTTIAFHDAVAGETQIGLLPFGGTLNFVVLDHDEADAFFALIYQEPGACPAVSKYPSGRTGVCTFRFGELGPEFSRA